MRVGSRIIARLDQSQRERGGEGGEGGEGEGAAVGPHLRRHGSSTHGLTGSRAEAASKHLLGPNRARRYDDFPPASQAPFVPRTPTSRPFACARPARCCLLPVAPLHDPVPFLQACMTAALGIRPFASLAR